MGQYPDNRCSDHILLLVCNSLTSPGITPGIPDKNAYKPQGKGVMGGLGISGQSTQVAAFPAATAAALVIFLMFLMLFITFSFLSVHDRPVAFGLGNKKGNVPSPYAGTPELQQGL